MIFRYHPSLHSKETPLITKLVIMVVERPNYNSFST